MRARHRALVVEDDPETAADLVEILDATDFDSVVVDNRADAVDRLGTDRICLVLLDLEIKSAIDSIKGHVEQGRALLRRIRELHSEHVGTGWWLPVLIVSGHARETAEAVDAMKDGASDIVQKPLRSQYVSQRIREALEASGRPRHSQCQQIPPPKGLGPMDQVRIAIPGDRVRRRTRVTIGAQSVDLTDASLKVLLHLIIARQNGKPVNKVDLGATSDQGFKGVSNLRSDLRPILGDASIIRNHYHGDYSLTDNVSVGQCAVDKLLEIGDRTISELARQLGSQTAAKKV